MDRFDECRHVCSEAMRSACLLACLLHALLIKSRRALTPPHHHTPLDRQKEERQTYYREAKPPLGAWCPQSLGKVLLRRLLLIVIRIQAAAAA